MASFTFSTAGIEPDQGRVGALPRGWYPTMVDKTELKPSNSGTGLILALTFVVIHGAHKGARFFTNFNVKNDSEQAMDIARKQLTALCIAMGMPNGIQQDTDELKGKPFFTRLKHVPAVLENPADPNSAVKYEEKNEPTAYRNINDSMAVAAFKQQGGAQTPAAARAPAAPPPVAAAPAAQAPAPTWQAPAAAAAPQAAAQAPAVAAQAPQTTAGGAPAAWQAPANPQPWDAQNAPSAAPAPAAAAPAPVYQAPPDDDMPAWMSVNG